MTPRAGKAQETAPPIERLAEHAVYRNRFVAIYDDDVRFRDGSTGTYVRVVQSGGLPSAAMLPLAAGRIGLVRVYRYPVGAWEWGIPRGLAHGGDPEATAREELLEELGARPERLESLGRVNPDSGILAGTLHMFAAIYPAPVSAPRDTLEVSDVRWVPVPDLLAMIADGGISDGYTLAAMCAAICRRVIQ